MSKDSFRCQELTWCGLLLDEPLERSGLLAVYHLRHTKQAPGAEGESPFGVKRSGKRTEERMIAPPSPGGLLPQVSSSVVRSHFFSSSVY